jgi:hypothetical protein
MTAPFHVLIGPPNSRQWPQKGPRMSEFLGTSADEHGSKVRHLFFDKQMVKIIFPLALHQFIVESDRIT